MKKISLVGLAFGLCLYSSSAQAISIDVQLFPFPAQQKATVTIAVSGLGNFTSPSLGAFDLDFTFVPGFFGITDLEQVIFLDGLGSPDNQTFINSSGTLVPDSFGLGEALTDAILFAPGELNLFEVSLLEANSVTCIFCIGPFLDDLQPSSFRLVTLIFDAPNAELTSLAQFDLSINALSDASGNALTADIRFIPLPSTLLLLGIGLVELGWALRKVQRH